MCLIVFAWQILPGLPLVAAGNRDEFYDRPAAPAAWWKDDPNIFAGRDLRAGGSWMGVTRDGRFAAVTNVRKPGDKKPDAPSRGDLVAGFLRSRSAPQAYVEELATHAQRYQAFNFLAGDRDTLVWYSNAAQSDPRNGAPLPRGIYGLSNGALETPWPKVLNTKAQFASLLLQAAPDDAYFEMLNDATQAEDDRLPSTGVSREWERMLSAVRIDTPGYGTRVSSLLRLPSSGEPLLLEKQYR